MSGEGKYSYLLEDVQLKRWYANLARGSPITADVTLRRLGKLCELLKTDPKGLLELARSNLMGFQNSLEDLVSKLEDEGKSPGYI
jgi:hypothetical protein